MITTEHVRTMARYNRWQNKSMVRAAGTLPHESLVEDKGAFWGSILRTLNHILWADRIWMARFEGLERPPLSMQEGSEAFATLPEYQAERVAYDDHIMTWAGTITDQWLLSGLSWFSGAAGSDMTMPCGLCVTHFFNHQTHHRGQVHAMLTAAGAQTGDTDLFLMRGLS
ncbi:MAG: DinB family protein [Pseudomonadota bacterium]